MCALEVSDSDATVCCDYCDHWVHVSCDPSLSMEDYNDMMHQWTHGFVSTAKNPLQNMYVTWIVLPQLNLASLVSVLMLAVLFLRDLFCQHIYWLVILMWWP